MVTKHKQLMNDGGVSKLHLAVFQGKQDKVKKLLQVGSADVNRGDKFGQTPLHIACHREGLLGCLTLLANHNADLEALDANGNTALHSAAGSGAAAAAEFLLDRGLSVTDQNKDGHTPMDICELHCPVERRKSMQALLEGDIKTDRERTVDGVTGCSSTASTATMNTSDVIRSSSVATTMTAAPSIGSSGIFPSEHDQDRLSQSGSGIDPGNVAGSDLSTTSGRVGSAEVGSLDGERNETRTTPAAANVAGAAFSLRSAGTAAAAAAAAADARQGSGRSFPQASPHSDSPRSKAIAAGAAMARDEHKGPLFTPRGGSATMAALGANDDGKAAAAAAAAVVGASRGNGVGVRERGGEMGRGNGVLTQSTPRRHAKQASLQELHLAIFQGDTAKVEEIVERGNSSALNEADKHGQTPLHLACYKGSRVMTRLLVEGGANLDAVDVNGNGVVHAAVCDSPAVLAILIDNGADVTVPNHDGLTPKRLCEQYCAPRLRERMLQLLKEATAAQVKAEARREQLAEGQMSIEAVYHQLAMLRSRLAATAAASTEVTPSEAAAAAQTENALLTLVEANVRVVEGQRHALQDLESTAGRLERMFRRLHMRLDTASPGDVGFS